MIYILCDVTDILGLNQLDIWWTRILQFDILNRMLLLYLHYNLLCMSISIYMSHYNDFETRSMVCNCQWFKRNTYELETKCNLYQISHGRDVQLNDSWRKLCDDRLGGFFQSCLFKIYHLLALIHRKKLDTLSEYRFTFTLFLILEGKCNVSQMHNNSNWN